MMEGCRRRGIISDHDGRIFGFMGVEGFGEKRREGGTTVLDIF
jgi:hypothetical protein